MKDPCDNFAELLIDYADTQLSAEESIRMADHLAECDNCRTLAGSLGKSLELAQVIWQDNLSQTPETIRIRACARVTRGMWMRYAAAAVILIVAAVSVTSRITNKPAKRQRTFAEIEQRITEAGNAAKLLAAAELLGGCSEAETMVNEQYRRIAETYPDTPAAGKAKSRIK